MDGHIGPRFRPVPLDRLRGAGPSISAGREGERTADTRLSELDKALWAVIVALAIAVWAAAVETEKALSALGCPDPCIYERPTSTPDGVSIRVGGLLVIGARVEVLP